MTGKDLYWLAGLLEGEGCFSNTATSPGVTVGMTDQDVVQRVAALFERGVRGPYKYPHNRKPVYYTTIWAGPAIDLMKRLLPHMGARRTAKIQEIVSEWKDRPTRWPEVPGGIRVFARCHPDRRHYAFNLCRSCYQASRRKKGLVH